jgi:hypothetical protein
MPALFDAQLDERMAQGPQSYWIARTLAKATRATQRERPRPAKLAILAAAPPRRNFVVSCNLTMGVLANILDYSKVEGDSCLNF